MPEPVHTISVQVQVERKVEATGADVYVTIAGSAFFSGRSALQEAREVRDFVDHVTRAGIPADKVHVNGVHVEVSSGLVSKSSSAEYRLRVEVPSTEQVTDVLAAVTDGRKTTLKKLVWRYDNVQDHHDDMLREALATAQRRAQLIADALKHTIQGVHTLNENLNDGGRTPVRMMAKASEGRSMKKARTAGSDFGMELSNSKDISLSLRVDYLVAPS